ncbi:hypothetical protein AB0O07_35295 [Streptomyces sp. NPDC093085]|uniref:hypothetical protein n=1 Tax=Streptomyces sp. NPDC093085 TaxID=3155068 RepID=UPI0034170A38
MTTGQGGEGWTAAVRRRLALGGLLALGAPEDGTWLAERAATAELRRAAASVPGAVLGTIRIALTDPDATTPPAVPPPPGAQPPGALRITADFAAAPDEPLPALSRRLRAALSARAREGLGLRVTEVDLRVTELLDTAPEPPAPTEPVERTATPPGDQPGTTAAAVPGVAHLTGVLGAPVVTTEPAEPAGPHPRNVRVELATAPGHHPLTVARAVRTELTRTTGEPLTVTVVVTAVEAPPHTGRT